MGITYHVSFFWQHPRGLGDGKEWLLDLRDHSSQSILGRYPCPRIGRAPRAIIPYTTDPDYLI